MKFFLVILKIQLKRINFCMRLSMFKIEANTQQNYLIMQLEGFFNSEEIIEAAQKTKDEVDKLKPGFIIINDISKFKPVNQDSTIYIKDAQKYVFMKGAKKVIRVVESVISNLQFNRTKKAAQADYDVFEVSSMEEALKMIES